MMIMCGCGEKRAEASAAAAEVLAASLVPAGGQGWGRPSLRRLLGCSASLLLSAGAAASFL